MKLDLSAWVETLPRDPNKWNVNGSFLKLGVPFLGVPIIRTIVFWGLYRGPLILGNYQIALPNKPRFVD